MTYRDNDIDRMNKEIELRDKQIEILERENALVKREDTTPTQWAKHMSRAAIVIALVGAATYTGHFGLLALILILFFF